MKRIACMLFCLAGTALCAGCAARRSAGDAESAYVREAFRTMERIAQGACGATDLKGVLAAHAPSGFPGSFAPVAAGGDSDPWRGTRFGAMGAAAETMAALCCVLPQTLPDPLSEEALDAAGRIRSGARCRPGRVAMRFARLDSLRRHAPALAAAGRGGEVVYMTGVVSDVLAFTRSAGGQRAFCLFNLSGRRWSVIPTVAAGGAYVDVVTGDSVRICPGREFSLAAWQYRILLRDL